MLSKVYTATLMGLDAQIIEVETDITRGERKISIVGLPDKAVQESRERMMSAFRNSDIDIGTGHKIINLAPANIPKSGPIFDLAMSVGILLAKKIIKEFDFKTFAFLGEVALDGSLRSISGVLPLIDSLQKKGFKEIFLPYENASEAALVKNVNIYGVTSLKEIVTHLNNTTILKPIRNSKTKVIKNDPNIHDISEIKGQIQAKRALEIAAAGGHNLLLSGIPGSGKTYLARTLPSILPDMTFAESLEVTRIHSITRSIDPNYPLITSRPFRSPHHTSSQVSLVGGGSNPMPGEISLAHNGVLFLDEFPEFEQKSLEALRQPLEDKNVHISRASYKVTYPANFQLIASMNPCKCGYFGSDKKPCICSPYERKRYLQKISGPIYDRFDLIVQVNQVKYTELKKSDTKQESSSKVKDRINRARNMQNSRFKSRNINCNAQMSNNEIYTYIKLDKSSLLILKQAIAKYNLSARGYFKILKVARTIADLKQKDNVEKQEIAEALSFRAPQYFT